MTQAILPQIKKIVFLMLENRSLDNVLGWLYEDGEQAQQRPFPSGGPAFDGLVPGKFSNPDSNGLPILVQPIADNTWKECKYIPYADPFESMLRGDDPRPPYSPWRGVMNQFFGGQQTIGSMPTKENGRPRMQGFYNDYYWSAELSWQGQDILWTYTPQQLPIINKLAKQFGVSDRWFASVPSDTNPNRAYSLCGTSLGRSSNAAFWEYEQFKTPTIFNHLTPAGKRWGIFYHDLYHANQCYTMYTFPEISPQKYDVVAPIAQFYSLAKAGNLPDFSYLEPRWTSIYWWDPSSDYHPPSDPTNGAEQFLFDVYHAVRSSPHWHETLLIITFDEHGGTYDHVGPEWNATNPDGRRGEENFNFDLFGARVPTILVSPYVPARTVFRPPESSKLPFDHTSFIKTLLLWAGVDPSTVNLGKRMPLAPTFEGLFADHVVNDGVPDFARPPLSAFSAGPGPGHPAGSREFLKDLLDGIPVLACRVLLAQNSSASTLQAAVARYREDPARFEAELERQR